MKPDAAPKFAELDRPSPNFASNRVNERLGVLIHHSVMSFDATIAYMSEAKNEVSYHCLIARDGTRCRLVADESIAWHAGASTFLGRTRCNEFLLGLAFAGDTYATPLTELQIDSALEWLALRWAKHQWTLDRIVDHRQVSPGRKDDLNPVEWTKLHRRLAARFGSGVTPPA